MTPSDVTVISVCYNSTAVVEQMLISVPHETPVVLVDNASDDGEALADIAAKCGARLLKNTMNLGFGVGCNKGAELAETNFLLFLNPDAKLAPDCLDALIDAADSLPSCVAFNPKILTPNGKPANKRRSVLLPRKTWLPRHLPDHDIEAPILNGAALFVRKSTFDAVGGFDENIFMYHEDDDISLRLKHTCGPLMIIANATVWHQVGFSTERTPQTARHKAFHMGRSRVYTARKHGLALPLISSYVSAIWQVLNPLVLLSRRKRAKQYAFMRGVMSSSFPSRESSGSQSDFGSGR